MSSLVAKLTSVTLVVATLVVVSVSLTMFLPVEAGTAIGQIGG